jgi:hypothetical protein
MPGVKFMKKLRGLQKLYLQVAIICGLALLFNAYIQHYYDSEYPRININGVYFIIFLTALFIAERYKLYYIYVGLICSTIGFYFWKVISALIGIEWSVLWVGEFIINIFAIVMLSVFLRFPLKVIKIGRKIKNLI